MKNRQDIENDAVIPFPDEVEHLKKVKRKLEAAIEAAKESVSFSEQSYHQTKHYMVQYRGEIDPHEMFQNELQLKQMDRSAAAAAQSLDKLVKLEDSPYFARIDFKEEGYEEAESYYIGRFTFKHENRLLIFDWRAPVAGMFYNCQTGPAGYQAPDQYINGELTRKRQFKIKNGRMEYALESADSVQDDVLQRELSGTSDERMKSIIATIQKEQNVIIRNEKARTMLIQGVAGSGKTSIALHRIAFLMYRYKEHLKARNVAIISPNKVFGDFISNVLPELGEEPIFEISFEDIADIQLDRLISFEKDKNPLAGQDPGWDERTQFKAASDFVNRLDEYIHQLPEKAFAAHDYTFDPFSVSAEWIKTRLNRYAKYPLLQGLAMTADDIYDRFEGENIMEHELPGPRTILKSLKKMLRFKKTIELYKDFYQEIRQPGMLAMPNRKTLEWNDVFPFLYLHAAFAGLKESQVIRHLLIDEMQDYTPIQYAVINLLFQCPKTILGDFGQAIDPNRRTSLEELQQIYKEAEVIRLTKSYRSTYEIIDFARRIHTAADIHPVERHGQPPKVIGTRSPEELNQKLCNLLKAFQKSKYNTLGLIVKTQKQAEELYEKLSHQFSLNIIRPQSQKFETGISIVTVQMSKGLEFDQVIVTHTDNQTYRTPTDRRLLYVACTRAMHQLTLIHQGEQTRLLPHK